MNKRRAGEADECGIGQRQPHVARELAGLGAVRFVGNHDDVVPRAVGLVRVHVLVELVDQAEDVAVVLLQQLFQLLARAGARRLFVRHAAADEGPVNLAVQVVAVGHQQEGELGRDLPPHLLREERHRIGLAAALRVPEDAQLAKIGMRGLHQGQQLLVLLVLDRPGHGQQVAIHGLFLRQFDHAIGQPFLRRKLSLQLLLPPDRRHRVVHAQHLMIAGHHLARRAGLAGVEQDEVLHDVQQPVMGQHAVEQHLGLHTALVPFVLALPLGEMLPLAGDRAVAGAVAVADDEEGVVVEGVGDDVLVQVVAQVAVEAGADVLVDRLQLDEDQRQAVDEADQVGPAVVARGAQAGDLQLAHGKEAVVRLAVRPCSVLEIDHPRCASRSWPCASR